MFVCKHCNKLFEGLTPSGKANHSRWCKENPNRRYYNEKLIEVRSNIKNPRNQFTKALDEGRILESSMKGKPSTRKDYKHTPDIIEKIRSKALNSKHRRLIRSTRLYSKTDGTQVLLDSSWEESLAKRLDELGIEWQRPVNPIQWMDSLGKLHNYFPDFYLPKFDIFLDPKNPQAIRMQKNKLEILLKQMSNLQILTSLEECQEFNWPK